MSERMLSLRLSADALGALTNADQPRSDALRALLQRIADGEPLPEHVDPRRSQVSLRISTEVVDRARANAQRHGMTLATAVEELAIADAERARA